MTSPGDPHGEWLGRAASQRAVRRLHLEELASTQERFGAAAEAATTRFEHALAASAPRGYPDLEAALAGVHDERARAMARRDLLRAVAAAACAPCEAVLQAGLSLSERSTRSIFRFAECAERAAALPLALAAYQRAARFMVSSVDSGSDFSPERSVLARFRLARLAERRGQPAAAAAEYERFLRWWSRVDRPLAEVEGARTYPRGPATATRGGRARAEGEGRYSQPKLPRPAARRSHT